MKTLKITVSVIVQEIELPKQPGHAPCRMAQANSVDPTTNGSERTEMSVKAERLQKYKLLKKRML
ncbi:MAG: hypothetical protein NC214_05230 [Candidatus Amulumruptor caecigallinarius]|nr:hypothetical protein [Candidatus Amulumruptor caecigallinarius]